MQDATLLLRDIHQPPAPAWWPPAPGWWLLAFAILLVLALVLGWRWKRASRRKRIGSMFDAALATADGPAAEVAAMSQLLRRAARRVDPEADRLQGEDWLAFLDRHNGRSARSARSRSGDDSFAGGSGRLLLDGPFRKDVEPDQVAALRSLARRRFQQWMGAA
ncbi:MAG: DUF4381 domain-containing protein [Lysobacter sp.]